LRVEKKIWFDSHTLLYISPFLLKTYLKNHHIYFISILLQKIYSSSQEQGEIEDEEERELISHLKQREIEVFYFWLIYWCFSKYFHILIFPFLSLIVFSFFLNQEMERRELIKRGEENEKHLKSNIKFIFNFQSVFICFDISHILFSNFLFSSCFILIIHFKIIK